MSQQLIVPKNKLSLYIQYILNDLYECAISTLNGDTTSKTITDVIEKDDHYLVTVDVSHEDLICKVLPKIFFYQSAMFIPLEDRTKELYYKVKSQITNTLQDEDINQVSFMTFEELDQVIGILVQHNILDSFVKLDNDSFLCESKGRLLIVGCNNGTLSVQRTYDYSFHIDEGFQGPFTDGLNKQFKKWKQIGDVTQSTLEDHCLSSFCYDL